MAIVGNIFAHMYLVGASGKVVNGWQCDCRLIFILKTDQYIYWSLTYIIIGLNCLGA